MTGDNWTSIIIAAIAIIPLIVGQVVLGRKSDKIRQVIVDEVQPKVAAIDQAVNTVPDGKATISARVDIANEGIDQLLTEERGDE